MQPDNQVWFRLALRILRDVPDDAIEAPAHVRDRWRVNARPISKETERVVWYVVALIQLALEGESIWADQFVQDGRQWRGVTRQALLLSFRHDIPLYPLTREFEERQAA
ncbi:MAG: hypothetical protein AAFY80_07010 [Pseudomonadota bacterium]